MNRELATGTIPHIIHQTWKNTAIPRHMVAWSDSWRHHHPDWEYRLWTDADNRELLCSHYPWLLHVYDNYPEPVMRADLARYCILHHCGGMYVDLDFECLRPLDELLSGRTLLIGLEPATHADKPAARVRSLEHILCNAFLASAPGHPFWETVMAHALRRCREKEVLDVAGPYMLSEAWQSFAERDPNCLLDAELLYPVSAEEAEAGLSERLLRERNTDGHVFAVHHWMGSWVRRSLPVRLAHALTHRAGRMPGAIMRLLYSDLRRIWRWLRYRRHTNSQHPHKPLSSLEAEPLRKLRSEELEQNILIAVPVKNAARFLPVLFASLQRLSYPHQHLSLAFLESDSDDNSWEILQEKRPALEREYRSVQLFREPFGYRPRGERNAVEEQLQRRSIIAHSRNLLLKQSLQDEDWVLWIDADVSWWPTRVIECLLAADRDIVVPHCISPAGDTFDLNTFKIRDGMSESDWAPHIRDGLLQPPRGFGRLYLDELREHECVEIDAVGGTMLLVRADLHRRGLIFPTAPYRHYIETEGLSMMARDMGVRSWGMPQLEIIHPLY